MQYHSNFVQYISAIKELNFPKAVIWDISKDKNGTIWIASGNGNYLFPKPGKFDFLKLHFNFTDGIKKESLDCFRFTAYDNQLVLIDSNIGLLKGRLEIDSSFTVGVFTDQFGKEIARDFIYHSIIDSEKNIWTATWKHKFKKYQLINGNLNPLEVNTENGFSNMFNHVRHIHEDQQKNIWISNTNGLFQLSKSEDRILSFPPVLSAPCPIESFNARAIIEDRGGHLWVSTMSGTVSFSKTGST